MSRPLRWNAAVPLDFPAHSQIAGMDQLDNYPSLSDCIDRLSILSNAVLEDEKEQSSSPLRKIVREIQDLMQLLSIHQKIMNAEPTTVQQAQIHYMAFHDALTGIPNRHFFEMSVRNLMQTSCLDTCFYLVFLDLDGFKEINDTYGHETGDMLLKKVAKRLRHNLRSEDIVARFGGDEFTMILHSHKGQNLESVLTRMTSFISQPYNINSLNLTINVSLGVAKYPDSDESYEGLIKKADKAMYMSKSKGNNLYTLCF